MIRKILTAFACSLVLLTGTITSAKEMADLPVTPKTTALTYLYCLSNDTRAVTDLLEQRLRYIGETEKIAGEWVQSGYCRDFIAGLEKKSPKIRQRVIKGLDAAGFNLKSPISEQAAQSGKKGKKKLGGLIGKIGKFITNLLGLEAKAASNIRYLEYTETSADGSSSSLKVCDKSNEVSIGGGGDDRFDPTPFNPN